MPWRRSELLKQNHVIRTIVGATAIAILLAGCGGAVDSTEVTETEVPTTVETTSAVVIGVATHEWTGSDYAELQPPLLAVEIDGAFAVVPASSAIFEEVELGEEVWSASGDRSTWTSDLDRTPFVGPPVMRVLGGWSAIVGRTRLG